MIDAQLYGYSPTEPSPYEALYNPQKYHSNKNHSNKYHSNKNYSKESHTNKNHSKESHTNMVFGVFIFLIIIITVIVCIVIVAINKTNNTCIDPPIIPKPPFYPVEQNLIATNTCNYKLYRIESFNAYDELNPNAGNNATMYTLGGKPGAITAKSGKIHGGFNSCINDVGTTQKRLCEPYVFESNCPNEFYRKIKPQPCGSNGALKDAWACKSPLDANGNAYKYNYNTYWAGVN